MQMYILTRFENVLLICVAAALHTYVQHLVIIRWWHLHDAQGTYHLIF